MVGLIRVAGVNPFKLTGNHQVIAYGYAEDGRGVTLRLYDPNWPDRDDVTVTIHLDPALRPTRHGAVDRRAAARLLLVRLHEGRPAGLALSRAARASRASAELRQLLRVGLGAGEQVTPLGDALDERSGS